MQKIGFWLKKIVSVERSTTRRVRVRTFFSDFCGFSDVLYTLCSRAAVVEQKKSERTNVTAEQAHQKMIVIEPENETNRRYNVPGNMGTISLLALHSRLGESLGGRWHSEIEQMGA